MVPNQALPLAPTQAGDNGPAYGRGFFNKFQVFLPDRGCRDPRHGWGRVAKRGCCSRSTQGNTCIAQNFQG